MQNYDLIIFDCDGTLVDSETLNNNVTSDILLGLGLKEYTRDACLNFFEGRSWNEMFVELKNKHGDVIPDNIVDMYVERVRAAIPDNVKIIDGALDLLIAVSKIFPICIASNGECQNVLTEIKATGLDRFFDESKIFTKVQVQNPKPAPDLFLYTAEKMKVDPSRCLVIEDSPTGVQGGVAAGMDVFGFVGASHDSENQKNKLLGAGAKQVFDDFIHIGQALKL